MKRPRLAVMAVLHLGVLSTVAHAQSARPQTLIGWRVPILTTSASGRTERVVGTLVAEDERTLILGRPGSKGEPVTIERSTVTSFERSVAGSRRNHGAALGLLIGGAAGALLGYASGDDNQEGAPFCTFGGCGQLGPFVPSRAEATVILGMACGAIGAGVGAVVAHGEQWQRIPDAGLQVGVARVAGGGIGVRLSFSVSRPPRRSR
jgi:hypothetical protein